MSERSPRSNPRLENFEANKHANERAAFEDALYGEAGSTDFSDHAKSRVEEADAYERHLEAMKARPEATNADLYADDASVNPYMDNLHDEALGMNAERDAQANAESAAEDSRINSLMKEDVHVRQMSLIAADISRIGGMAITHENEAKLSAELNAKEDRLQDLLMKFSENNQLSASDAETIMGRIIDMTEAVVPEQAPEIEAKQEAAEEIETASSSEQDEDDGETAAQSNADIEQPLSLDEQLEAAKAKLNADAEARAQQVIDDMYNSDQAKADRELLEPISTDGLDPVDAPTGESDPISLEGLEPVDGPNAEPAREGESLEEYEARTGKAGEIDTIDVDGLEPVDPDADESTQTRSRSRRLRDRFSPTALAARASAWNYQRGERAQSRERSAGNRKAMIGLGVLGVVAAGTGIYLANKYGLDFNGGNGGGAGDKKDLIDPVPTRKKGGNGLNWIDFDPSARRVDNGEGFYSTFKQMGIPKENWADTLNAAGPKLQKLGEAYYDGGAREWRISEPGNLSQDALRVIASSARKDGVEF